MSFLYEEEVETSSERDGFECDNMACGDADKSHCADIQNDRADAESGVEPDSNEWIFQDIGESVEFDITAEQAMATLRYFTSTADRTNLLTKTHHHDLDVISGLLQEKEKDLELAARIGQSLLQRNKNLLLKIEAMEDYVSNVTEQENQMRHEVSMKNELIKSILHEEEALAYESESTKLEPDSRHSLYSFSDSGCKDESILALAEKCRELEKNNFDLLNEALMLRDLTKKAEDEEQELVVDCVKHLAVAKEQITHLTDEIALKFEDNVAQQEEITELINMVVELQRKHKQLSYENDELQYQLDEAHQDKEFLQSQLFDMQRRFEECADLLKENQDEVKTLREKVELNERDSWSLERSQSLNMQHDSLALEIEETVKRELTAHDRNRERTSRVLEQVRNANKYLRPGSHYSASNASHFSSSASVKSDISIDSDDRSVKSFRSTVGSQDFDDRRKRGFLAAEKLQIVKPMEGSVTLHKWHHLASENVVAGLNIGLVATPGNQTNKDDIEVSPIDAEPTDCSSTLSNPDLVTNTRSNSMEKHVSRIFNDCAIEDDNDDDEEEDDFGLTFKADRAAVKSQKPAYQADVKSKQSTPLQMNLRSMADHFSADHSSQVKSNSLKFGSPDLQSIDSIISPSHHDRSIITRNSSILDSMREARSMLKKENGSAQSKANAIDILANAMSKANVEAKTGQRILESVATRNTGDRTVSSKMRKDYEDMPKVNRVLQRLASDKEDKKVNLHSVKKPLKLLVERATDKKDAPAAETEEVPKKDSISVEAPASRPHDLPALLTIPLGMRAATGIFGNFLHQSGASSGQTSLLSTVFSSNITAVGSEASQPKQTLSRSWSSGDIKSLSKQEISDIGPLPANSVSVGVGRVRSNSLSIEGAPSLSSISKSSFNNLGVLKRSNSSGSFSELAKETEIKTVIDSPPKEAPFVSFDNYGVEDLSFAFGSSVSTATSASIATTTTTTTVSSFQSDTTSTLMPGSKPTGFLRSLFLRSSGSSSMQEVKRPSSVYETDSNPKVGALGKGSSSSAESGMNRFGKALAQDDFSGFGFGFMSYFGGSKGSNP